MSATSASAAPDVVTAVSPRPPHQRVTRVEHIGDVAVVTFISSNAFYGSDFPAGREIGELVDVLGRRKLLLDFSAVEVVPSYALGWLLTLHRKVRESEGHLILWKLGSRTLELLELCRLDRLFTVVSERDHRTLCAVIRAVFGNAPGPAVLRPEWCTDTAVALARWMSEARDFTAMPILADALQDAGCDRAEVLDHCRGPGPHVRGCWVVDLVLGKGSGTDDRGEVETAAPS